ncbi:hypothetical protein RJ55_10012 [Drechmeria coniospora]|nr:hypothetical protein RJ55_10012 [Drechmeria coniospora]
MDADMPKFAQRIPLTSGWTFKQTDGVEDNWLPVTRVPTVVHLDLINNGRIPDPFIGLNELAVEWVGEKAWTYRTSFSSPRSVDKESVYLLFGGLDTIAKVKLNGTVILESDNMFLSHRIDITQNLLDRNLLIIEFESALQRGRDLEREHREHRYVAHNGESGRIGVRKAQYHWGWDWGPVLMTSGPWRPIVLEVSAAHIKDAAIKYEISADLSTVAGNVEVQLEGPVDEVILLITYNGIEVATGASKPLKYPSSHVAFSIAEPALWYPAGYGDQPLYDFTVEIVKDGTCVDRWVRKTGFRRVELVQELDTHGESFYFRVNDIDVFAGGSCWIPADNFLPRITRHRYNDWMKVMVDGHQNMIRVWGGGIYEDDAFYDSCDQLGILVWQDFMFACASYPAWKSLRESVDKEARQNIKRLRHHPSVVIYCGNNEDYQTQEHCKLEYDWENKDPESWLQSTYPARYYYEHLLPRAVAEESSGVPYWPGSPFSSKGKEANDMTAGDVHQWKVWHGACEKYQKFDKMGGRFVSEFGLVGLPQPSTISSFCDDPEGLHQGSRTLDFHNKAHGHERRIATYISENFVPREDLKGHIYLSQLVQSEALAFAYRGWRRQWGEGRRCGGALVWQLNDCWPCSSWAIVDYFLRKKAAYYAVSRQMRPVAVGVQREHHDWTHGHARPAKRLRFDVWVSSSMMRDFQGDVEIRFVSIETGAEIKPAVCKPGVAVSPNGTTVVFSGDIDCEHEEPHVIAVRLCSGGEVISRDMDWPQPFKYLRFPGRGVEIRASADCYTVTADRPTKCLLIEEVDGVRLSDNGIDLVAGDVQVIQVTGMSGAVGTPRYQYLGQDDM